MLKFLVSLVIFIRLNVCLFKVKLKLLEPLLHVHLGLLLCLGILCFLNRTFILIRFLNAELSHTSLSACETEMDSNRTAKVRVMT